MVGGGIGCGSNKVVATLRADGKVYPTEGNITQLSTLINYKIRTESEVGGKTLSALPTTVVDLGKQLLQFARDGDVKGVKNMLVRGAPFTSDWLGMSALHFAAMNNQYEICEALLKGGINKDWKTKVDRTPLHFASFYGNQNIVELLLSKKCAVNARDMLRMTPLHWAVDKGFKSIVRILLKHNADVTLASKFGKTPIAIAVLREQADLLEELETAKQLQANQKFSEATEKETSEAVNSIMDFTTDVIEEPEHIRCLEEDVDMDDELNNASQYSNTKISDLKEAGKSNLDNTAINLLKSHGISMMPDDYDESKQLLTTALQNGRQLVLSEGGKMLLSETKRFQNPNNNNHFSSNNNTNVNGNNNRVASVANSADSSGSSKQDNSSSGKGNNNSSKSSVSGGKTTVIIPMHIKSESAGLVPQLNKYRSSMVAKAKDSPSLNKNKNIRIISLNDFKKLYGNANIKSIQKVPTALAKSRVARQLGVDAIGTSACERKMILNVSPLQMRQMNVSLSETANDDNIIEESVDCDVDEHIMSNVIKISPDDSSETEASDNDSKTAMTSVRCVPISQTNRRVDTGSLSVCQLTSTSINDHSPVKTSANVDSISASSNSSGVPSKITSPSSSTAAATAASVVVEAATEAFMSRHHAASTPTMMMRGETKPMLVSSEICRQLHELRKANEELRRKFDLAQREKEEMRQRIERLEELLFVEQTYDEVYTVS